MLNQVLVLVLNQVLVPVLTRCAALLLSDLQELRSIIREVKHRSGLQSTKLLRQLKRRDRLVHKRQKNYDVITACLQAVSQKRRKTRTVSVWVHEVLLIIPTTSKTCTFLQT